MANLEKKVVKEGSHPTHKNIEGKVSDVVLDEQITDPNDPRAVQVPEQFREIGNPLDAHLEDSPNEESGDGPAAHYNPHTGEAIDGSEKTPSPVPDNVEARSKPQKPGKPETTSKSD